MQFFWLVFIYEDVKQEIVWVCSTCTHPPIDSPSPTFKEVPPQGVAVYIVLDSKFPHA